MRPKSLVPAVGTALLALGSIVACSDSTAPSAAATFEAQATTDLAPSAGAQIATDAAFYGGASASSLGGSFSRNVPTGSPPVSFSLAPSPTHASATWLSPLCQYNSTTQLFTCPLLTSGFHSYTVSYQLFDSLGAIQPSYNSVSTDSIRFTVSDTGAVAFTWNSNSFADTSSHHRNATLSNLKGDPDTVHIWNATGTGFISSVRSGQITKIYHLTSSDTTTDLKIRLPRYLNPYPLSGTIIRNYTVVRTRIGTDTVQRTTTRRVVVTFNGTADVTMTVGGTPFTLNLFTHMVTKQ